MPRSHPAAPEVWLGLWRTVWLDLPLALAGGPGLRALSLDADPASEADEGTELDLATHEASECAPDPLEELQMGCFA